MKDQLVEQCFTEVSTQSFAKKGDVYLANPLDKTKPALRTSLEENLADALERATRYAPLVLPPGEHPKLFEVGTVFPKSGEYLELRMTERVPAWGDAAHTVDNLSVAKLEEYGKGYEPMRHKLGPYTSFSVYPFVLRDIALWTSRGTEAGELEKLIREHAGELLVRLDLFARFEKSGRVSYAFRLVFSSLERTLTDEEVNVIMENISAALAQKDYEVR
jgi:phenylalanyl-tRNA synthetase beta subunit